MSRRRDASPSNASTDFAMRSSVAVSANEDGSTTVGHLPVQDNQIEGGFEICGICPQGGFVALGCFQHATILVISQGMCSRHCCSYCPKKRANMS